MGTIGFGLAILLALGALGTAVGALFAPSDLKVGTAGAAALLAVVAVVVFVLSGMREVPTNSIGVPTAFGHVETSMNPGIHWKAPWTKVNILDKTIQTTTFEGNNCLSVRIGGQQTACLDATIQWNMTDQGAPSLFKNYNNGGNIMTNITDAVVVREFKTVVNDVLGDYNPIQDVAANSGAGNSQFSGFGKVVESRMQSDLAGLINVRNVYMPLLRYDASTQARLNLIQAQYAQTAIAGQLKLTNEAQAKANAAIGLPTVGQLQYLCYQIVQEAEKTGFQGLPATFSCNNGSGNVAVAVGAKH